MQLCSIESITINNFYSMNPMEELRTNFSVNLRMYHGALTDLPSGALSSCLTPHQTENLPQCVQACIRLLNLSCKVPVNLVSDVPNAMDGFLKPVKWGWEGLDVCNLKNCIEKLIQLAQPTEVFILQTHHTDTNTSLHCCCIEKRMLCCPSDEIWRPLCLEAFAALHIDRIIKIYKKGTGNAKD